MCVNEIPRVECTEHLKWLAMKNKQRLNVLKYLLCHALHIGKCLERSALWHCALSQSQVVPENRKVGGRWAGCRASALGAPRMRGLPGARNQTLPGHQSKNFRPTHPALPGQLPRNSHNQASKIAKCLSKLIVTPMIGENRQLVTDEPVEFEK